MPKLHLYLVSFVDTRLPTHPTGQSCPRTHQRSPRGAPTIRIHWTLLLSPAPAVERADAASGARTSTRYHATCRGGRWTFERRAVDGARSPATLARVRVGTLDVRDGEEADQVLCGVRVRGVDGFSEGACWDNDGSEDEDGDRKWDCRSWVEDALRALEESGLLNRKRTLEMEHLFDFAQRFSEGVAKKGLNVGYSIPVTTGYSGLST